MRIMDTKVEEFEEFVNGVWAKMEIGEAEHGDKVWTNDPSKLIADMQEECEDIVGWGFILHQRLADMQRVLANRCKCMCDHDCEDEVVGLTKYSVHLDTDSFNRKVQKDIDQHVVEDIVDILFSGEINVTEDGFNKMENEIAGLISCYRCDAIVDKFSYAPCHTCRELYCPECINVLSDTPTCDDCE